MFRKIKTYIILILFIISISACSSTKENPETEDISGVNDEIIYEVGTAEIMIFDCGKADSILITAENCTVLIDAGENKNGKDIAEHLLNNGIEKIDYLILTHFDNDHIGGADKIIESISVGEIIVPDYGKDSKQYIQFTEAAEKAEVGQNILREKMEFALGTLEFTLYPTNKAFYSFTGENANDDGPIKENDFSIVISVTHGKNKLLFAGDAMADRISELLKNEGIKNTEFDFLKVPHHGKYNNKSSAFINSIQPKYAVITCSEKAPADDRVVSALENVGAEVYLTSNGGVLCVSDGNNLTAAYEVE